MAAPPAPAHAGPAPSLPAKPMCTLPHLHTPAFPAGGGQRRWRWLARNAPGASRVTVCAALPQGGGKGREGGRIGIVAREGTPLYFTHDSLLAGAARPLALAASARGAAIGIVPAHPPVELSHIISIYCADLWRSRRDLARLYAWQACARERSHSPAWRRPPSACPRPPAGVCRRVVCVGPRAAWALLNRVFVNCLCARLPRALHCAFARRNIWLLYEL
jgi:hypothetical protein